MLLPQAENEGQRYGRNKDTAINHTYINSGSYRRKFDFISDSSELNRLIFQLSKKMLEHRSGIKFEDMYWIDAAHRTMLANSEFIIMLNQASTDRIELAKLLNISDLQMSYITGALQADDNKI